MEIGNNYPRVDGYEKASGKAKFTADLYTGSMLVGKPLGSSCAQARIRRINTEKASSLPGVVTILTPADAPAHSFSPRGNPYSFDAPAVNNMRILTDTPRLVGDPIAAVIAIDEITAERALGLIEVEYETGTPAVTIDQAMAEPAALIHQDSPGNIMADFGAYMAGDIEAALENAYEVAEAHYSTSPVQHCHLEPCCSFAYSDAKDRITIVSGCQTPFFARRRCAEALGLPERSIRIVKPYLGGGFGNRQDVVQEPLNALLTMAVGGQAVRLCYTREETMNISHTRYGFEMDLALAADAKGRLTGLKMTAYADGGAYAVHNHAIALTALHFPRYIYDYGAIEARPVTVYTNHSSGGAMRGYGMPQGDFAIESAMDDLACRLHMDPLQFRLNNLRPDGYVDPPSGVRTGSNGLRQCLEKGAQAMDWYQRRQEYDKTNSGSIRRGIGVAAFAFVCSTYPYNTEVSGARILLNEDGSFLLQIGATEIGQGSDTVFAQLAAETLGVPTEDIIVNSTQDTDVSPYDGGAFATRQTYTGGSAVVRASQELREKICAFVRKIKKISPDEELLICAGVVVKKKDLMPVLSVKEAALYSYFDKDRGEILFSETSLLFPEPLVSFGCTFADVEVDMRLCRAVVRDIRNIHDSGRIINPQLAAAQVHGGMAMGIGAALYEKMLFDADGRLLNGNFLDYKIPTAMDVPELGTDFVEAADMRGPYGAKGIGEPPAVSPAPAIRNAILQATGVAFNSLPITPQRMFEAFSQAGLI